MYNTLKQYLNTVGSVLDKAALTPLLSAMADRFSSQATSSAGLVISATTTTSKTGATPFAGVVQGVPVAIAAGTDMPALTGLNITAGSYNVFCYYIDAASVVTVLMGTEATTLAGVKFPQPPVGKALVGYLVVTYASPFVGGTTVLSTATTVYVSPVGAFDPTILIG
jgi:hypothetical protein